MIELVIVVILAASSEPSDSAPIPPTQENMEEQQQAAAAAGPVAQEDGGEEEETEEGKDTARTDQPEPVTTDTFNEDESIIEKPDHDSPPRLPDDFYYEAEKIHAKPLTTDEKNFPGNTLSL